MNEGMHAVVNRTAPIGLPELPRPRLRRLKRLLDRLGPVLLGLFILAIVIGNMINPDPDIERPAFRLVTGTENRNLVPIFDRFAADEKVKLEITYQGSVDTMLELQGGAEAYDAVWPASSIWLAMGDSKHVVGQTKSIMATPVVFGLKRPVAERLGWVGREVTVEDILAAAEAGQIRYMTSSATQSNSGAMAYLGYLYAFAGQPPVLTHEMLRDPAVIEPTTRILGLVDRTAGASGYLRDLFLQEYDAYDGMVNNESAIITANQELTAQGRDPLYVIYPVDGLAIADWPLGYVDHGNARTGELFARFQTYLLSDAVQAELLAMGRRTGLGLQPVGADPAVFNPEWGIDLSRVIVPITLPPADVIQEALVLYQTELRKPAFTVICLDFSGSMKGAGERDVKAAMRVLLEPAEASRYYLQRAPRDVTVVLPFDDHVIDRWRADGNDPAVLRDLLARVNRQEAGGDTNIYDCASAALDAMSDGIEGYAPAVILMTDGHSTSGHFSDLQARLSRGSPGDVPIYAILFGDASEEQLTEITEATSGRIFDGQADLIGAFRQAFGYT